MKKRLPIPLLGFLAWLSYRQGYDQTISSSMIKYHSGFLTFFAKSLSFIGSVRFLLPFFLIFIYRRKGDKESKALGLHTLAAWGVSNLIKLLVGRNRPTFAPLATEKSLSFPSSHAMTNQAFYSLFARLYPAKSFHFFCQSMVVLIALSRVYLGVHFLSDILAGMAFGQIYVLVSDRFFPYFFLKDTSK